MPYRPTYAQFELYAVPPLAGVFPASAKAAAIGSAVAVAVVAVLGMIDGGIPNVSDFMAMILGSALFAMLATIIAAAFCAFYISVIGVPLAWALGRRLGEPAGLAVAIVASAAGAVVVAAVFEAWPFGSDWAVTALALAYALPAGVLYRRAVLDAHELSPFAEHEPVA